MFWRECSKFQPIFFGSLFIMYAVLLFVHSLSPLCFARFLLFDSISELGNNVTPLRCVLFMLSTFRFFSVYASLRFIIRQRKKNKTSWKGANECAYEFFCWIIQSNSRGMWHEMWMIISQRKIIRPSLVIDSTKKTGLVWVDSVTNINNWQCNRNYYFIFIFCLLHKFDGFFNDRDEENFQSPSI